MNIANFSDPSSSEQVALAVSPGSPDILSLSTTNIPQVHARLTELRLRADHPANHPREVWIDLTRCNAFVEVRGEVLVRALRLTQFLPRGFIGTSDAVSDMARSANLPRVDSPEFLPRIAVAHQSAPVQVSRVEFEQQEDIAVDMQRRLSALEQDNLGLSKRADVLAQALVVVREQRDRFGAEVKDLQASLQAASGQLEWASLQGRSSEDEVANVMSRLERSIAEHDEASSRALALENGMALVEQALADARDGADAMRRCLLETQESEVAATGHADTLSSWLSEANDRNALIEEQLASREAQFQAQRAEFEQSTQQLQVQVVDLNIALADAQSNLSVERENIRILVDARDDIEKQASLTSQMLEDALKQVDGLTDQAAHLSSSLDQYRTQWQTLSEDYARAREQLLAAQEESNQANLDLVALNTQSVEQAQQIIALSEQASSASADRSALLAANDRNAELAELITQATERVASTQVQLDASAQALNDARAKVDELTLLGEDREREIIRISFDRDAAMESANALGVSLAEQRLETNRIGEALSAAREEVEASQSALLETREEVGRLNLSINEQRVVIGQLNERLDLSEQAAVVARAEAAEVQQALVDAGVKVSQLLHSNNEQSVVIGELNKQVRSSEQAVCAARAEVDEVQQALLDAGTEVAQLQQSNDEQFRANGVLNDLAQRNAQERSAARAELEDLNGRFVEASEDLSKTRAALLLQAEKEKEDAAEFARRLAFSQAEGESLARRLATVQDEAHLATTQFESIVEDLRASVDRHEIDAQANAVELAQSQSRCIDIKHQLDEVSLALGVAHSRAAELEVDLSIVRNQVRSLEGTVVEQHGVIEKISGDLIVEQETASALREKVAASDTVIGRQQDQLDTVRQAVVQGSLALRQEQQAHSDTQQECVAAQGEVVRLANTVREQVVTIDQISGELTSIKALCADQGDSLAHVDEHMAAADRLARAERKARALVEAELMDAQDKIEDMRRAEEARPAPVSIQAPAPVTHHDMRVRSGQRITAMGDLIVSQPVSSSAELVAQGSVHIYGPMHGRVHAGCAGDLSARIYCLNFAAEQVAIGGRSVVFETISPDLLGKSVEIWFDQANNCMQVKPLVAA